MSNIKTCPHTVIMKEEISVIDRTLSLHVRSRKHVYFCYKITHLTWRSMGISSVSSPPQARGTSAFDFT